MERGNLFRVFYGEDVFLLIQIQALTLLGKQVVEQCRIEKYIFSIVLFLRKPGANRSKYL